jgi:hypothetical protein
MPGRRAARGSAVSASLQSVNDEKMDHPCPPWCVNGDQHLRDQVERGTDFHHLSEAVEVPDRNDPALEPIFAQIYLDQLEEVDDHGISYRHAAEVFVKVEGAFLPDYADRLARVLNELASEARSTRDSL